MTLLTSLKALSSVLASVLTQCAIAVLSGYLFPELTQSPASTHAYFVAPELWKS
ncbi:MAG: hypothetical protein AAF635_00895 [Cyanobacteria bacterium P01_C01_bin.69]